MSGKRAGFFRRRFTIGGLRVFSSIGFIVAQYVFLFHSQEYGLRLFIASQVMGFPYFVRKGYWDIVALGIVGLTINVAGLIHLSR
jgi:hypothetical protein